MRHLVRHRMVTALLLLAGFLTDSYWERVSYGIPQDRKTTATPAADAYRKWVEEDVKYIISPEEESVFRALQTREEKERFIEQFWQRRNPDPGKSANQFQEEHYRRIAYANSKFSCALPGWKTDRGRIYILHGPPSEVESHPQGGTYYRPWHEGGGVTMTFPYEIWRYDYIPGVGANVELEFVDPTFTREYRLASHSSDKDALFRLADMGLTVDESRGLSSKQDRRFQYERMQDNPFQRYKLLAALQRPPQIKHKELKEVVRVGMSFDSLPFALQQHCFLLDDEHVLIPLTVEVRKADLTLRNGAGIDRARMAVYGIVRSMLNEVLSEFEHEVDAAFAPGGEAEGNADRILFQKMLVLRNSNKRCRLDLVVKDLHTGRLGHVCQALSIVGQDDGAPSASSLVLAESMRKLQSAQDEGRQFVWGDIEILPSATKSFSGEHPLHAYFHLYNVALDRASARPVLTIVYAIAQDGQIVKEFREEHGESLHSCSPARSVFLRSLPIGDLAGGKYTLSVEVRDALADQSFRLSEEFEIARPPGRR